MTGMNLFGISLSGLFGKSRKTNRRKSRTTQKHVKKGTRRKNGRRKRGTRKYKMRGGWGEPSLPVSLPTISKLMKGGWGSDNEIIM